MIASCCQSIIGCEACVAAWYEDDKDNEKNCPNCRSEGAKPKTFQLRGVEDVLSEMSHFSTGQVDH